MSKPADFEGYVESLCEAVGHADRHAGLVDYCRGLMLPIARKSVEPLAAHTDPWHVSAKHQSLHHFVAKADWSDEAVLARVRAWVIPKLDLAAGAYWIVDDTGHPKQGTHSVGVARQYCGQLGKQDNCQVAVSLSLASSEGSVPVAYRLYLPEAWAEDRERRAHAGVPEAVRFATKGQIALAQIRAAHRAGLPQGVVLADAAYGANTAFRQGLAKLGLRYAVGVLPQTNVWAPGTEPLPPKPYRGTGRPPTRARRASRHRPISAKALAISLPESAWSELTWREGTNTPLSSRFAATRVRSAHQDHRGHEQWLLVEWPRNEAEPTKYWLSNLPADTRREQLVYAAKMRWRIERDYQELKQEFGLSHYEGRGWRGFHHHATLCIAAYGFLMADRLTHGGSKKNAARPKAPRLPKDYTPRGSRSDAAPRARFDSDLALPDRPGNRPTSGSLPLLRYSTCSFLTQ